jgi:hypothetical protein
VKYLAQAPPSAHTTTSARRRLTDAIAGRRPSRRRRPSWRLSLAGSGLAAAAAGVALVLSVTAGTFYVSERRLTETWTPRDHDEQAWEGRQ